MRIYINFWWQYLAHKLCFSPTDYNQKRYGISGKKGGLRVFIEGERVPLDHEIFLPFSFDTKGEKGGRVDLNDFREHREEYKQEGHSVEEVASYFEGWFENDEKAYLEAFEGWFLRDISSDSLCPEEKIKLFAAYEGINRVFITPEELEGDAAAGQILAEQAEIFRDFFNFEVRY